jgi:hypothetical protein
MLLHHHFPLIMLILFGQLLLHHNFPLSPLRPFTIMDSLAVGVLTPLGFNFSMVPIG